MQAESENNKKNSHTLSFFNGLEGFVGQLGIKSRRQILWDKLQGEDVLEIGVGKGQNFSYYPSNIKITAIDSSQEMLRQARKTRKSKKLAVELVLMDVQSLCYADNSFDSVIATFVFSSVSQPIKGLQELHRVCKPGGQILLLERVLSSSPIKARVMKIFNPLISLIFGSNINRQTVKSIQACGFQKVVIDSASSDTVKLIQAVK